MKLCIALVSMNADMWNSLVAATIYFNPCYAVRLQILPYTVSIGYLDFTGQLSFLALSTP